MLHTLSRIEGRTLAALDGTIGTITDLLFDDRDWCVRWAVVLSEPSSKRHVLVPAGALGPCGTEQNDVAVHLTRSQVLDSEEVDTHRPVSRQREIELLHAYGWDPYWGDGRYLGYYRHGAQIGHDRLPTLSVEQQSIIDAQPHRDDPNLRSMARVLGTRLHAKDGDIGSVADFVVDDTDWGVVSLVAAITAPTPGDRRLVDPRDVTAIS